MLHIVRPHGSSAIYHLFGGGVWVGYFPDGFGPGSGDARLLYRDARGTRTFSAGEIGTTVAPGLGLVITVVVDRRPGLGETTFSLVLPHVTPGWTPGTAVPLSTFGVTMVHRAGNCGRPQCETYSLTMLSGESIESVRAA
jgi:hypothetical protein